MSLISTVGRVAIGSAGILAGILTGLPGAEAQPSPNPAPAAPP